MGTKEYMVTVTASYDYYIDATDHEMAEEMALEEAGLDIPPEWELDVSDIERT